jgi:hypothetical protein
MFLHIENLEYIENYKLRLVFSNQATRDVDLQEELYGEIFEPLKDLALFQQVFLSPETKTIEWPNGADFAPEFLYSLSEMSPEAVTSPSSR